MAARPKIDFEDLYLSLKEKHMNMSREMREKEEQWKVERIKLRKGGNTPGGGGDGSVDVSATNGAPSGPASPNGGKPAPAASASNMTPRSATALSGGRPSSAASAAATPAVPHRTRPASALAVRGVNRIAASASPSASGATKPAVALSRPAAAAGGGKTPPPAAPAAAAGGKTPASRPNAATTAPTTSAATRPDDVSFSEVLQLGALSRQLNSELSAGRLQPSPVAARSQTQPPMYGGTTMAPPPVHFEVVSMSPESHYQHHHHQAQGAAAGSFSSILQHPGARRPPETSMFWGVDSELPLDATITGRTLAEVNDRLRAQLKDCEVQLRRYSQEQAINRQVMDKQEHHIQQLEHQVLLIVQERDAMAQRTNATSSSVQSLQHQLEGQLQQHEAVRGSLEVQCRELRNRLLTEIDRREFLERELGKSRSDVQEQMLQVASLQSRVSVSEGSLASQRNANETLLVEMKGLNDQLAAERRKTLETTRDVHLASHTRQRAEELELQLKSVKEAHRAVQAENLRLLEQVARCSDDAMRTASETVGADLAEFKAQAANWERVSLLQFRELEQMSKQRAQLRLDFEAIKADRDDATLSLAKVKSELVYATAKLDLCWPSHVRDTAGLNVEQIRSAFSKMMTSSSSASHSPGSRQQRVGGADMSSLSQHLRFEQQQQLAGGGVASASSLAAAAALSGVGGGNNNNNSMMMMNDSLSRPIKDEDLISELQAANSVLMAENESLRLQNSLFVERLEELGVHYREKTKELETNVERVVRHEAASMAHATRQTDRIGFLESMVRGLRGSVVDSSTFSVDELNSTETVLEVFLGKMLLDNNVASTAGSSAAAAAGVDARAIPSVVAVVDFLIHESTVSSPILPTMHASFDQTFAYRVNADAVLLHSMANGTVCVEIHEVHDGTQHTLIAKGEMCFRELINVADARRPTLRSHVNLFRVAQSSGNSEQQQQQQQELYGRLELVITSRVPFPSNFVRLCAEFRDSADFTATSSFSGNQTLFPPHHLGQQQQQLNTSGGGRRTLFMPDPRDTSLSFTGVGGHIPADSDMQRGHLSTAQQQQQQQQRQQQRLLSGGDALALLLRCNQIKLRFLRVAVEFTEKESPLLSWWYSFGVNLGESWVLPREGETGKFDAPIEVTNIHEFASSEELVTALRKTIPVVAFDEEETNPAKHWGVASMALGPLIAAPNQVLSIQLPVLSPSGRTRAILHAEASIASVNK